MSGIDIKDKTVLYSESEEKFSNSDVLIEFLSIILKVNDLSGKSNISIQKNYLYFFKNGIKINRISFPESFEDRQELMKTLHCRFVKEGIDDPKVLSNLCCSVVEFCNDTESSMFEQFHFDIIDSLCEKISCNKAFLPIFAVAKIDEGDELPVVYFLYFSNDKDADFSDVLGITE